MSIGTLPWKIKTDVDDLGNGIMPTFMIAI
jgi:hypothetical protein